MEVLVSKFSKKGKKGEEADEGDFFIPDYQREFRWPRERQSRFIESVLIGLPVPLLFVADVAGQDGKAEVVDGVQRMSTLADFMNNELTLIGLEMLDSLNGFTFADLPVVRQRRFGRQTIRMIELREGVDDEVRRNIFKRLNSGGLSLNDMEIRWGGWDGPFLRFIRTCSENDLFKKLAPMTESAKKLREPQELVLRFFAYLNRYQKFNRSVMDFLNGYLEDMEKLFCGESGKKVEEELRLEFERMLVFVDRYIRTGFSQRVGYTRTPRIRFEAMAVGTALALRAKPDLVPVSLDWLASDDFKGVIRPDSSNSAQKVARRLEFVRDKLLGTTK